MSDRIDAGHDVPEGYPFQSDWEVTPRHAAEAMRSRPAGFIAIDCREPSEWDTARVEGMVLIPLGEIQSRIDEIEALDGLVLAHHVDALVELVGQGLVEDLVDEGALAGPGNAGDAGEDADGELRAHGFEVVFRGREHFQVAPEGEFLLLTNRSATNPVEVNDLGAVQSRLLVNGDVIRAGVAEFVFLDASGE